MPDPTHPADLHHRCQRRLAHAYAFIASFLVAFTVTGATDLDGPRELAGTAIALATLAIAVTGYAYYHALANSSLPRHRPATPYR